MATDFVTILGGLPQITKDPAAALDYVMDWSAWLSTGETLTQATFTAPGLTLQSQAKSDATATVWLAGGTAGMAYTVSCAITTTSGRTDERSFVIMCANR